MNARVLILTAGYGEGHNAAARAVHAACEEAEGSGTSRLEDIFALSAPRFHRVSRGAYLDMIHYTPRLWSAVYRWVDRHDIFPGALRFLRGEMRTLARVIRETQPEVICSTYPVYGYMIDALRRREPFTAPHFNVVTDSISINSLWWKSRCDGWFVPNEETAAVMRAGKVDPARLHVFGFPVSPFFERHRDLLQPPSLAEAAPRVLYMVNSGTRNARETVRRLIEEDAWDLTCAVGRNDALRRSLAQLAVGRKRSATFLGWTQSIPELLMTHHVTLSKAGGATTQEAIAARCPLLVNQIVPGQEEGNFELLRRHQVGAYVDSPAETVATLRRAFAENGRVWKQWRASLEAFGPPSGARLTAEFLLRVNSRHAQGQLPSRAGIVAGSQP